MKGACNTGRGPVTEQDGRNEANRSLIPDRRPVRVRLLLAKFWGEDETPTVVAAIDETVWEHWEEADEKAWRKDAERAWGLDPTDCEWREVVANFDAVELRFAFAAPSVQGRIAE